MKSAALALLAGLIVCPTIEAAALSAGEEEQLRTVV